MAPLAGEAPWLHLSAQPELVWDLGMCADTSRVAALREAMARAHKGPLAPAAQQQLVAALVSEAQLVFQCGLTPGRLPALVEHNPGVAVEALLRLLTAPQAGQEYLAALAGMEMSLHSMEVVNRLTTVAQLPLDFVHLYVSNCVASCEAARDKYVQNRLVRLLCVFLQSLIRNKIVTARDLFLEVHLGQFCLAFAHIREAADLYRLLAASQGLGEDG